MVNDTSLTNENNENLVFSIVVYTKMNKEDYIFDPQDFNLIKEINKDFFSSFVVVLNKKTKERFFAQINQHPDERQLKPSQISNFIQLSHPAIQNIIGFSEKDFHYQNLPVIFSQNIPKYTLKQISDLEIKSLSPIDWCDTKKYITIYGIASGMSYLHSHGIIHKNLKPSAILFNEDLYPMISDYIFTKDYHLFTQSSVSDISYIYYIAPEFLGEKCIYNNSVDVYSFSMIVYQILTGKIPFYQETDSIFQLVNKIKQGFRPEIDSYIHPNFKNLIERCWSNNPSNRPNFDEIVEILSDPAFIDQSMCVDIDEFNAYVDGIHSNSKKIKKEYNDGDDDEVKSKPISIQGEKLDLSRLKLTKKIGIGISGDVYKVIDLNKGDIYAAKMFSSIINEDTRNSNESINFLRELDILSKISHPTILKFIGCSPIDFQGGFHPIIVTELLINNSLEKVLEIERKGYSIPNWTETRKFIFIYGIAFALNFLHLLKILHRDIKPSNILIDDYLFPKICDFGFSKPILDSEKVVNEIVGTPAFIAPEIYNEFKYSEASDVYAYGMLVYEMMEQKLPFQGLTPHQIMCCLCCKNQRPQLTNKTPQKYKELITSCWNTDPSKRPTFKKIVEVLKNDSEFKPKKIDVKLLNEYFQFIEKKKIEEKTIVFKKYILESLYSKYEDEYISTLEGEGFVSIDDYSKFDKILQDDISSYIEIINRNTGQKYSARVSNISIENYTKQDIKNISQEIRILSKLKHRSIQRFHGFSFVNFLHQPNPVIINEYSSRRRLFDILENERKGDKNDGWNDTKKLINIYGIASGMSYLHSNSIIHFNLNPKSILVDNQFHPKISNIGFHTNIENSKSISSCSINGLNDSSIYLAPEVLNLNEKTKKSDVYSFSLIVYEIVTNKFPFKKTNNLSKLISDIVNKKYSPQLDNYIPKAYRNLIKQCSEFDPKNRPSFDKIVESLKLDPGFITNSVNKKEYLDYIRS